ncbi:hypothetical protein PQO03_11650 [Lentisphaera profundi]|uniref:BPL/LPL catalytic domain-containing protein n=1 Tax=Lentisphaera profundi TaxID=1658616 RepID=A0ABY7VW83_9BACT|nr:hypothetical protein [Lentisphaera profundi]WDE98496.1 hypothetical protein PQO03_11650 [Lentisphaera profundi]
MDSFRPLLSENSDFLSEEPLGESVLVEGSRPIRVWQPKHPVVVLGRSQKAHKEVHLEATKNDAIPVFKRMGGGGCVLLDEGCACVAIRYKREKELNIDLYLRHSSKAIQAFLYETYGLATEIRENYDLSYQGKKFLGASLYMPRDWSVYSCVILLKNDSMKKILKYLTPPSKQPAYREDRKHEDFLSPLENHVNFKIEDFISDLETFLYEEKWYLGPKSSN